MRGHDLPSFAKVILPCAAPFTGKTAWVCPSLSSQDAKSNAGEINNDKKKKNTRGRKKTQTGLEVELSTLHHGGKGFAGFTAPVRKWISRRKGQGGAA